MEEKKQLTCKEAGRNGGNRTKKLYGKKYYKDIGRKGGISRWHKKEIDNWLKE